MSLRKVPLALAGLLLVSSLSACTGGDDDSDSPDAESPTTTPPAAAELELGRRIHVTGELKPKARDRVRTDIKETLDRYLSSALLGDYPRKDFTLAGFTDGAEKEARKDLDLLTGKAFATAESVTAEDLVAELTVLAPGGRPAGATAKVRFVLDVDGTRVFLRGRLLLSPREGHWRIFGYDVSSNASDVAKAGGTS